ncbi:leukocyte-associated immunoglobulin-like receptor 2 isoform 2-T2 [Dama dama]|uniref:leukocyte-associated immunoglobulin-like receptor 2 isoform X2 n=1 Tax=Dama dama TaxID=30532 RepID=UPI002A37183A|nr:leukocyte-associated immunoglobulin-like receptor 2 isoform X2 [Dama dama]
MAPGPSTLLGLVLCLAQMACTQQGTLPRPSISAEPGSVVPWGRPVSIVCRGPAGVRSFRLEKDNRYNYMEVAVTSRGEQETEARFRITALHEDAVGRYHCIYGTESSWSERSETLSLEGTEEAVSALPTGRRMLAPEAMGGGNRESTEVNQELRGWDEEAPVKAAPDRQTPAPRQPTPPRTTRWRTGSAWAWLAWSC